jgi:glycine cleavage system H lipoate-binding protein
MKMLVALRLIYTIAFYLITRFKMVAIFVVLTFIFFILVDYFVLKAQGKTHPAFNAAKVFDKRSFLFPDEVIFSNGHLWLLKLRDGMIKIGIDEFIQKSLGNLTLQPVVAEGMQVRKGDQILQADLGRKSIKFYAPVDGRVKFVNKNLGRSLNDPYGDDWGVVMEPATALQNNGFKSKDKAVEWLHQEFSRLKDFLSLHMGDAAIAGATMYDGGNIVEGVISMLNDKAVKDFEEKFLQV